MRSAMIRGRGSVVWFGAAVIAAALTACGQQEQQVGEPQVEEKTFALTPSTAAVKATFLTGELQDMKVTERVEKGANEIGKGVEETAKGIGSTAAEGAKYTGEKLKESGKAAEPKAKSAWHQTRDGAVNFGSSVKKFF